MTDCDRQTWSALFPDMDYHAAMSESITSCSMLRSCKTTAQIQARKHLLPEGLPDSTDRPGWNALFRQHLGATLAARLFPHQRSAIARMLQFGGRGLLACAPGTGKTSMVICISVILKLEIKQLLIICPSIAISSWCLELHNWAGMDERDIQFITTTTTPKPPKSTKKARIGEASGGLHATTTSEMLVKPKARIDPTKRIIITTFAIATMLASELQAVNFTGVVVDESHALKNENSQRSKAIVGLMHQSRYAICMTGTPADKVIQLFGCLHAVRSDLFPSLDDFGMRFCDIKKIKLPGGNVRHEYVAPKDKSKLDDLNQLLYSQVMFRVGKEVLTTLPPKYRVRKMLDADTDEGKLALQEKLKKLAKDNGVMSEEDSVACDALLLASDLANETKKKKNVKGTKRKRDDERPPSPHAPQEGNIVQPVVAVRKKISPYGRPPKLDAQGNVLPPTKLEVYGKILQATLKLKLPYVMAGLRELIASGIHLKEKVLLFAHHDRMLNFMGSVLEAEGLDYIRIDGKVSSVWRRGELCSKFQHEPKCRFAVLSIAACSTAVTLTAGSHVVFAEMVPLPSSMLQAGDRAHRIGQTKPVTIAYWILKGSLDETLYRILEQKEAQMDYTLSARTPT